MKALVAFFAASVALAAASAARADFPPLQWCGNDAAAIDRVPDRVGGPQVHVVYVLPSDGIDRFSSIASALATDVAAIDAWWRREDPTRAPRFDLFEFPGCATRFGRLDITSARLPDSTAALGGPERRHDTIAFRLAEPPFSLDDPTKKYLVFYDGDAGDTNVCGTGSGSPNRGGAGSIAIAYLRSACGTTMGTGLLNATVAAHELLHALGALPFGAPNACPADTGHPCDDERDILYPFLREKPIESTLLDAGHNDYYAHGGTWFDVQDSLWLLHAQQQVTLSVTPRVGGAVRVGGIDCSSACDTDWDAGTNVVLVAQPAEGYAFASWGGACSGHADVCSLMVGAATSATATFARLFPLTVTVSGRGSVSSSALQCDRSCTSEIAAGTRVALRARAARGWRFVRWTGGCRGTRSTCTVRIRAATRVRAVFARR